MERLTWSSPRIYLLMVGHSAWRIFCRTPDLLIGAISQRTAIDTQQAPARSCEGACSRLQQVRVCMSRSTTGCLHARDSSVEPAAQARQHRHMRSCGDARRRTRIPQTRLATGRALAARSSRAALPAASSAGAAGARRAGTATPSPAPPRRSRSRNAVRQKRGASAGTSSPATRVFLWHAHGLCVKP